MSVVVVGAGLMGVGIALTFARAGRAVRLVERDAACRATAVGRLDTQLELLVHEGLLTQTEALAAAQRVTVAAALDESLQPAPLLVVEAITEDLELKRSLFRSLDAATPPSTLLCSNTSGLSISAIAAGLEHPERVCGAHFWNPPHLIPLVEVVRGERTSEATITTVTRLLSEAGKTPVVVNRDIPGFVGNRLLHALQREAMALVSSGIASAEEVDLVVTEGFGRRLGTVGPLALCDLAGLDLVLQVDSYLLRDLESSPDPDPLLVRLVERGEVGVRSLKGFLTWTQDEVDAVVARRDTALIDALLGAVGRQCPAVVGDPM